jgi:hypothetical protein
LLHLARREAGEVSTGMTFDLMFQSWTWKPIPHCPGRFVLRGAPADLLPEKLLAGEMDVQEFPTTKARDKVLVAEFEGGGLISYARPDGTYCDTLNTTEGFGRKLAQLGGDQSEPRA